MENLIQNELSPGRELVSILPRCSVAAKKRKTSQTENFCRFPRDLTRSAQKITGLAVIIMTALRKRRGTAVSPSTRDLTVRYGRNILY
jgi:hypothetical protein